MPRANAPANMTPMAVSSLTRRFVATTAIEADVRSAEHQRADEDALAQQEGDDDAGEDGVGQRVADEQRPRRTM